MQFRRALGSDIPVLIEMRLAFLSEMNGDLSPELRDAYTGLLTDYFERCLGSTVLCYLAEEKDVCVSSAFLTISEKPASNKIPNGLFGTLLNVYTKPEYRRRGLAAELIRMAIEDARAWELSSIELMATPMGERIYRGLGFAEQVSDNVPMVLKLN